MNAFYAVIPADIRYDKRLPANAKLLYGEITALCNEKGFCWATNSYFAELYGVHSKTISDWIGALARLGYISISHTRTDINTRVETRRISIPTTNAPPRGKYDCTVYEEVIDTFNSICRRRFPRVKHLTQSRIKAIDQAIDSLQEGGFAEVFERASKSDFLQGDNDRGWTATFDWIITPASISKILEGNYDSL